MSEENRQSLNTALNDWVQGQQDSAINAVAPLATSENLPAVVMLTWFYAQRGNAPEAAPYVRIATDAGLVLPGLWFAGRYASATDAEQVQIVLDVAQNIANGAPATDLIGQWTVLWNAGFADAALRLFEEAAEPFPAGPRAEWERLSTEARGLLAELQSAAAGIEVQRDAALDLMRQSTTEIEAEATRVRTLVDETTSFVHGLTATELAKAYTKRANDTQSAARWWTGFAIVLGIGAAAWAAVIAHDAYNKGSQTVAEITAKALLSLSVLVLAGYIAQIAANTRRMAWHWAHVALQISTAEPFIGNLEKNTRERLLAALAVRLFPGQSLDPQSEAGTHESLDVGLLLAAVLGETAHPTVPSVGEGQADGARQ